MTRQDKEKFRNGTIEDKKIVLRNLLETQMKVLKRSPDINVLRHAQGQAEVLESLLSALD